MTCKLCEQYGNCDWAHSDAWERSASNYFHLLSEESEKQWAIMRRAEEIFDSDPASAFRLYVDAAEAGSVCSMEKVGWHYWTGTGVVAGTSSALEYYRRADPRRVLDSDNRLCSAPC